MTERKGGWITTFSGGQIYPLDARPEEIDFLDIAHALSQLCRYGGHCREFYSVAQHSCLVSDWVGLHGTPQLALWGLLHDASEAYLVDMPRPIKHSEGFEGYRATERALEIVIARKFNLPGDEMPDLVREADNRILLDERKALLAETTHDWGLNVEPLGIGITPWAPKIAEANWLARFHALSP